MAHARDARVGLLVGVLVGLAIVGLPLFDDLRSYLFSDDWLAEIAHREGHEPPGYSLNPGPFIPEIETMLSGALALVVGLVCGIGLARGHYVRGRVLVGGVLALVTIVYTTVEVSNYAGDATVLRLLVLPVIAVAAVAVALVIAIRHPRTRVPAVLA